MKSAQLQQLQKKISVLKNELRLIDQMMNRRKDPVFPKEQMTTCTTSKQIIRNEADPNPEVCGFPVYQNPFCHLSDLESHIEGQFTEIPVEVEAEEMNEEEVIQLIDHRKSRTQRLSSENQKSIIPVVEPVVPIQNVKDSVQKAYYRI